MSIEYTINRFDMKLKKEIKEGEKLYKDKKRKNY